MEKVPAWRDLKVMHKEFTDFIPWLRERGVSPDKLTSVEGIMELRNGWVRSKPYKNLDRAGQKLRGGDDSQRRGAAAQARFKKDKVQQAKAALLKAGVKL